MRLPSGQLVDQETPIYPGSFFTWGEATKNLARPLEDLVINNNLILHADLIEQKIIATAEYMDKVRRVLGDRPLRINSWYRPPHINRQVGGSLYSRHQFGDAVDFVSDYFSPAKIYRLLDNWHGDLGGLGRYYSFSHLDLRGKGARWSS